MVRSSLLDRLTGEAVVMFVGAHPDDETMIGPLMAYCGDRCRELFIVSLTRGDGGHNLGTEDLTRRLTEVRDAEMTAAVGIFGGTPVTFGYVNGASRAHPDGLAVLDSAETARRRWQTCGDKGQTAEITYARWTAEAGDPAATVRGLLRERQPTVVIALDPVKGFTNHPEHVTVAQATLAAVKAYSADDGGRALLYYAYRPTDDVEGAERFTTADLVAAGGKDYLAISKASWAEYESQYGLKGSGMLAAHIGDGVQEFLIRRGGFR